MTTKILSNKFAKLIPGASLFLLFSLSVVGWQKAAHSQIQYQYVGECSYDKLIFGKCTLVYGDVKLIKVAFKQSALTPPDKIDQLRASITVGSSATFNDKYYIHNTWIFARDIIPKSVSQVTVKNFSRSMAVYNVNNEELVRVGPPLNIIGRTDEPLIDRKFEFYK